MLVSEVQSVLSLVMLVSEVQKWLHLLNNDAYVGDFCHY